MSTTQQPIVCDDALSVSSAAEALRSASHIAFDCEGRTLGEQRGCLSVISLGAIPSVQGQKAQVFLIDVMSVDTVALGPIFDILRSRTHVKIVFDGRMDWSELYHRHGIQLSHVLDLQLADVESRKKKGEDLSAQLRRLGSFCNRFDMQSRSDCYTAIHRLNGLDFCMKEHGISINPLYDAVKPRFFSHDGWMNRPLPESYIEYAATDIKLITRLYADFVSKGYIEESELIDQSERYISLHRSSLPPPGSGHCLLPLGILSPPSTYRSALTCGTCARSLSPDCFSQTARNSGGKRNCWVCRALSVRQSAMHNRSDWDF